jgi:hypothetical protein
VSRSRPLTDRMIQPAATAGPTQTFRRGSPPADWQTDRGRTGSGSPPRAAPPQSRRCEPQSHRDRSALGRHRANRAVGPARSVRCCDLERYRWSTNRRSASTRNGRRACNGVSRCCVRDRPAPNHSRSRGRSRTHRFAANATRVPRYLGSVASTGLGSFQAAYGELNKGCSPASQHSRGRRC